jgi:autotransporter-associated beta strand protein
VILPAQAELVGVSVSGEAVRADEETRPDGSLVRLIPLIQTRAGQRSLEVRLIYRMKAMEGGRLTSVKSLRMDDPELLGISAERTLWTAIVPKRLTVGEVDGNMEEVAEESKVVERLQGLMSDFSRMNKALSSRGNVSKAEGDYTLMEAEKLARQIEVESNKVEQLSRSKSSYSRSKPKADDDGKELKMQEKVLNDITDLNESIVKQKVVLTENRAQAPVFNNAKDSSLSISNTWSANNAPTGGDRTEFEGFVNYGSPIAGPATDAQGNSQSIVLNDNTLVQNDFLKAPLAVRKSETQGSIAGAAGVTVLNSGAGSLDLSGASTYAGATSVGAGTLILGTGSVAINGGTQMYFGDASAALPGHGNAMPKEQAAQVFNAGNNGRANVVSQTQAQRTVPDVIDMPDVGQMFGGRSVQNCRSSNPCTFDPNRRRGDVSR